MEHHHSVRGESAEEAIGVNGCQSWVEKLRSWADLNNDIKWIFARHCFFVGSRYFLAPRLISFFLNDSKTKSADQNLRWNNTQMHKLYTLKKYHILHVLNSSAFPKTSNHFRGFRWMAWQEASIRSKMGKRDRTRPVIEII